jgi:hypothetical protein
MELRLFSSLRKIQNDFVVHRHTVLGLTNFALGAMHKRLGT